MICFRMKIGGSKRNYFDVLDSLQEDCKAIYEIDFAVKHKKRNGGLNSIGFFVSTCIMQSYFSILLLFLKKIVRN
jgi:hypothetical protein